MDQAEITEGIEQNKAFKKEILDKHRPAFFDIWLPLAQVMEEAVVKPRVLDTAFARALDLFFIEAFKSHQSLYLLAVAGHEEDAATIGRRLLEIAFQVSYLCSDSSKREERGEQYLAHFWHSAQSILASIDLPEERRKWWEERYEHHKKRLQFDKKGNPVSFWFGSSLAELATDLGYKETYEKDYRFLSHIAHCSSRGVLVDKVENVIQVKSHRLIDPIIVYSSRYVLWVTANWNEHFALIPNAILEKLRDDVIQFDFKGTAKTPTADVPSSQ